MRKIKIEDWIPTDGLKLEDNARKIVKSDYHSLVIAGPGAGKTELLAQRACYLLQTNECKFPQKILAISFKSDAAANLKDRVTLRCGNELTKRFDSMTYDAFAKNLFDRFKTALPTKFLIKGAYNIGRTESLVLDEFKIRDIDYFNTHTQKEILDFFYTSLPYPITNNVEELKDGIWMNLIHKNNPTLPFKMIMRLAELIINSNPLIKSFLQKTYQYVFLDEFQDTTNIQYNFLESCFFGSSSIITAVGDDKQRIMTWAGAKETAFSDLKADIGALEVPLFMNFRSAPRLVALQNYLVQNLLKKPETATPSTHWEKEDGECHVWVLNNPDSEKEHLFKCVKEWIDLEHLNPREICILVKQHLEVYAGDLINHFNSNGIKARNESELQNLLSDELIIYFINLLYSTFTTSASHQRQAVIQMLQLLNGIERDQDLLNLEIKVSKFQIELRQQFSLKTLSELDFQELIQRIIGFTELEKIKANFSIYQDAPYYNFIIKSFINQLSLEYRHSTNLTETLDNLVGKNTIPVMTVHKSKGLEYHSVIFVGLEDGAFWSYQNQPDEDNCTFFVALSRAKKRVAFTFCRERLDRFGRLRSQKITNIKDILDGLEKSGIANLSQI